GPVRETRLYGPAPPVLDLSRPRHVRAGGCDGAPVMTSDPGPLTRRDRSGIRHRHPTQDHSQVAVTPWSRRGGQATGEVACATLDFGAKSAAMAYFDHFAQSRGTALGNWLSRQAKRSQFVHIQRLLPRQDSAILEIGPGRGHLADLFYQAGYHDY